MYECNYCFGSFGFHSDNCENPNKHKVINPEKTKDEVISALQARVQALEGASKKLIDKMKEVYETAEYLAVFQLWQSHNGQYKGMQWAKEFDALEAILKGEK